MPMKWKFFCLIAVLVAAGVAAIEWLESDKLVTLLVPEAGKVKLPEPGDLPPSVGSEQSERLSEGSPPPERLSMEVNDAATFERLFRLQRARDLLREIAKKPVTADLAEIKNATLLACLSATSSAAKERLSKTPAGNRAAVGQFTRVYCEGIGDSPELANARAAAELDQASIFDDSEIGRANRLSDAMLAPDYHPNEAQTQEWLDLLLQTRMPTVAHALALEAMYNQSNPVHAFLSAEHQWLGEQAPGTWDAGRGYQLSEAVAAIIACRNGPLCAPDRAYAMTACMDHGNCAAGATLLDIRRDSMSPQDWRIAEAIVASLQARRRAGRDGG